jgi:Ser/Thr protein kinase RdoA (MazF antagonist)
MSYDERPEFDVQELVDQYGLGGVRNVRKAEGGEVNENWIVRTATDTVVVRRVTGSRSLDHIRFEHSFIRALGREGFPYRLPQPLRTRGGRSVVTNNGKYVWLYNYIEGSGEQPSQNTLVAQMAHAMATAHRVARRFSLRPLNATPIVLENPWLLNSLRLLQVRLLASKDDRHRFFGSRAQECIGILERLRYTRYGALPHFAIHGDMCRANVIFSREQLRGVIDFGHSCSDTAIRDIAIALRYECARDLFRLHLDVARRFLKVYHEINPLTREETDLIPAIVIAELADLFHWKTVETTERGNSVPIAELDRWFKSMRWYNRHQKDIARALRM